MKVKIRHGKGSKDSPIEKQKVIWLLGGLLFLLFGIAYFVFGSIFENQWTRHGPVVEKPTDNYMTNSKWSCYYYSKENAHKLLEKPVWSEISFYGDKTVIIGNLLDDANSKPTSYSVGGG